MACSILSQPSPSIAPRLAGRKAGDSANKKGPQRALICAPPRIVGRSSTHGGAPSYEYDRLQHGIPHETCPLRLEVFISVATARVKLLATANEQTPRPGRHVESARSCASKVWSACS